jgi:hypothetical protein
MTHRNNHSSRPEFLALSARVRAQARRFEATLVARGIDRLLSAHSRRRVLENAAQVAQRRLARTLKGLEELYEEKVLVAVLADDRYLDGSGRKLSRYTLRQRRVALCAYLRIARLPGRSAEEARAILGQGLRRAAEGRGYRRGDDPEMEGDDETERM